MTDTARIDRMEVVVARHDELIDRCVNAMERPIQIDERLANHLEETKRQWAILDSHAKHIAEMNQQVAEILAFYALFRRVMWPVLSVCGAWVVFLVGYWMEMHGWLG